MLEAEIRDLKEILKSMQPIAEIKYKLSLERVIKTIESANIIEKAEKEKK